MTTALKEAMEHVDTRQMHFTMPLQLEIARNASLANKGNYNGKGNFGVQAIQNAFGKGNGKGGGEKPQKGKGGGKPQKGKNNKSKSVTPGPEKRRICYSYNNNQGCDGSCGMAHVCQICLSPDHGKWDCETIKKKA
jgi:hypothetical protein